MRRLIVAIAAMLASPAIAQVAPMAVVGPDPGPVQVTATPAAAAHAAGTSVGGLLTIPLGRGGGGTGILTNVLAFTSWGSTQTYVLRIWEKQPASTTCTDNTAFAGNINDDAYLIGNGPIATLSFAAPSSTTGDTKTYAALGNLVWDYRNKDTTPSANLYACLVTVASDTPGASATLSIALSGPQN